MISLLLFSFLSFSQTFVRVGTTISSFSIVGDKAYVFGGLDTSRPKLPASFSVVDLKMEKTEKIVEFDEKWSLYRGAFVDGQFYTSIWNRNELFTIDINQDLQGSKFPQKPVIYKEASNVSGMESVVKVGSQIWVAYSNFLGGLDFGEGHIAIIENGKKVASIRTETPNPKTMIPLPDGRVAISLGIYNKIENNELVPAEDGQVVVIDPRKLPKGQSEYLISSHAEKPFYRIYNTTGTPGQMTFSNQKIFACDLDFAAHRFFVIDMDSSNIETIEGEFADCGGIAVHKDKIYVAHFSANEPGEYATEEHLYVFDRDTKQPVCSQIFYPGRLNFPGLLYPNQMEIYKTEESTKLIVTFGVYPYLGMIDIDDSGIPEGCQ